MEGSVEQALKGEHYNRAQRLYKLAYEALARQLIQVGREGNILPPEQTKFLFDIIRDQNIDSADRLFSLETLQQDTDFKSYLEKLFDSLDIPENHMAKYMISLMEMIEILLLNIDSIRTHNWKCYLESIRLMMPWMMAYDCTNYGRWLPIYWADMKNLSPEHSEMMCEIFAQSLTNNPYSAQPGDMWIECTMNKGSKLKSGWKKILKNEKGLFVHTKNANNVNAVRNALRHFLSEVKGRHVHKENVKSRLKADEQAVQDMLALFKEWQCNPFDADNQELRSLQSGALAGDKLVKDFETAHEKGEEKVKDYFKQRLFSKEISVFKSLGRCELKNFHSANDSSKESKSKDSAVMESKKCYLLYEKSI